MLEGHAVRRRKSPAARRLVLLMVGAIVGMGETFRHDGRDVLQGNVKGRVGISVGADIGNMAASTLPLAAGKWRRDG